MELLQFVKEHLGEHKVSGKEIIVKKCPYCGKEKHKFSINYERGLFQCFSGSCREVGSIGKLYRKFGLIDKSEYNPKSVDIKDYCSNITPEIINFFKSRGITEKTIKHNFFDIMSTVNNDIRAYLKEFQVKKGYKPDIILVDYLDLMMPLSVKVSPSDLFIKDKYVSEELRNLAMETNAILVTASQLNRSAVEEIEFDHSHISGGLSKIQTADNVIGIFTSRAMKERGRYQIQFMKTRSSSGVGQKVDLEFNLDTLRISDIDDDSDPAMTTSLSTMKNVNQGGGFNFKKTSTVKETVDPETGEIIADPTKGASVPKVKAQVGGSKLREMLANLNSEKD